VWLSGGWDSTAVLGAAGDALGEEAAPRRLRAVSVSYPPGDPGREDELIASAAGRWGVPIRWIDVADVPLLDNDPRGRAARRDEPFAHAFEGLNRALACGSGQSAARVAFDGAGGDQLFQASEVFFADLLRQGRWRELAREWRAKGLAGRGWRVFGKWAVQPLLPDLALRAATLVRGGRPLHTQFDRTVPPWIRPAFARRHELAARERAGAPSRRGLGAGAYETHWYLTHPYFPRVMGTVAEIALAAGTELRSPLYDRRVIEFAVARPRTDRSQGRETKRLLRGAMRGLLPESLLAPRPRRTGTTSAYLARGLRLQHAAAVAELLAGPLALEAAGVVDGAAVREAWSGYVRRGGGSLGVSLLLTVLAELWLRARTRPGAPPA
jgi:asparagine synthase (glutamine-hydrolysing)